MYTICFDTICTGYAPITDGNNKPVSYATEQAAFAEFYEGCFVCPMEEIGHKTIYMGASQ